jgi:hypothetical protein
LERNWRLYLISEVTETRSWVGVLKILSAVTVILSIVKTTVEHGHSISTVTGYIQWSVDHFMQN